MAQPSYVDLADLARNALVTARPDLTGEPGTIPDFLVHAAAAGSDYLNGYATAKAKKQFLDTAFDQDLTDLADDRYAILRTAATKAVGSVTLSRPTAAAGAGSVAIGTIVATGFNALGETIEFETTTLGSFGGGTLTVDVAVQALIAGSAGNVAIGEVNRVVSALFDPTIQVTNAARLAGGAEEESDESLKERVRTFPTTIRRATIAAIEYGAKTVPGVVSAKVFEDPAGIVTVYVADGTGYSNAELNAAVQLELVNWRAAGVVLQVVSAAPLVTSVGMYVRSRPGFDVAASVTLIQDAIEARMDKYTMGEVAFLDQIKAAVFALAPDKIDRITFTNLSTDIIPADNQVVRAGVISVFVEPYSPTVP